MSSLSRRHFLGTLPAAAAAQAARPNVLMIMADDLGFETLNCNGGTSYKTPNLDRLAREGVRFTHAYAQPLCTPTRVNPSDRARAATSGEKSPVRVSSS